MIAVDKAANEFLYLQVVDLITGQVDNGTLRPGDRLPSLRRLSRKLQVSIPTVRQAYLELERQGRVEARPKSGYFVHAKRLNPLVSIKRRETEPLQVECQNLIDRVWESIHRPGVLPLGIANPCMAAPATKTLHRAMKRIMARAESRSITYAPAYGEPGLCRQIAYRYLNQGGSVDPHEILVTNGGQEALALALKSVAKPGDVIAVEGPAYYGMRELIESLGMLALEIETCPIEGVILESLESALRNHQITACMFSSSINNPLGCMSSDEHREELVKLVEKYNVPLIEDDVYGELYFEGARPKPAQFFSRKGLVLTVGSFSKTVAPGYRVGWLLLGNYGDKAKKLKRAMSCSSGLLQQLTLAEFMASHDYDRHLNRLRPILKQNSERLAACVEQHFPANTGISRPRGGSVLWLEMDSGIDSEELFDAAMERGISIVPGDIFSADSRYRNFIRLSFGHPWSDQIEDGIATLGHLVNQQMIKAA